MSLRNFFKFHKLGLPISVFVVSILLYFHLKGFKSWSDIPWHDIRFLTEFILIVLVIPTLTYIFGLYYYTCAVITVKDDKNTSYSIVSDGKKYYLSAKKPHLKIYFSRKGKHSVYLYDVNGIMIDSPQKANTYEHYIDYIEFKKNTKNESKDAGKENRQSDAPSIISNSSKQDNNEKT